MYLIRFLIAFRLAEITRLFFSIFNISTFVKRKIDLHVLICIEIQMERKGKCLKYETVPRNLRKRIYFIIMQNINFYITR